MGIFKKSLAVLLAVLMLLSIAAVMASAEEVEGTYYVVGTPNLCGSEWLVNDENNLMELGEDGLYYKTFTDVAVAEGYQFKITQGDWNLENWGVDGQNVTFNVVEACDVTITFNAETKEIGIIGDGVVIPTELKIDYITAVGDNMKDPAFLNGISWDPAAEANRMSTEDGKVFTITYKGVAKGTYQVKFAANGAWTDNWGFKDDS
ncbi:MAG: hypothetical protein J1E41_03160, partial [Ruminococcus sp.]|nr:hypothetical protein [Ruminococcus sp.]